MNTSLWTIEELAARVARALSDDYAGQPSDRVREVPDARTIRYYTTLGLLDRPAGVRGRKALYGPRHLLQLVAIKRMQAEGASLVEIQAALCGLSDETLRRVARAPSHDWPAAGDAPPVENAPPGGSAAAAPRAASFWSAPPAPPQAASEPDLFRPAAPAVAAAPRFGPPRAAEAAAELIAARLDARTLVCFAAERPLDAADLEALRAAAAPLLQVLAQRRLVRGGDAAGSSPGT